MPGKFHPRQFGDLKREKSRLLLMVLFFPSSLFKKQNPNHPNSKTQTPKSDATIFDNQENQKSAVNLGSLALLFVLQVAEKPVLQMVLK